MAVSAQIQQAFGALAPMLDSTLNLAVNPRDPKQRRTSAKDEPDEDMPELQSQHQAVPVVKLLTLLANLVVRHDQELQTLRKMDQFIFF